MHFFGSQIYKDQVSAPRSSQSNQGEKQVPNNDSRAISGEICTKCNGRHKGQSAA